MVPVPPWTAETTPEEPWAAYAIADGRLITGQNPASGGAVADLVIKQLQGGGSG